MVIRFEAGDLKGAGSLTAGEVFAAVKEKIVADLVNQWFKENAPQLHEESDRAKKLLAEAIQMNMGDVVQKMAERLKAEIERMDAREMLRFLLDEDRSDW
jgi:hypothetical protein